MAYLNFQIEHHLFPSMPQYRHPKVAPRVQALFAKHGVEHGARVRARARARARVRARVRARARARVSRVSGRVG